MGLSWKAQAGETARSDQRAAQREANENKVLARAAKLDPEDKSEHAEYLREVAGDITDHRESACHRES
ncbi:MAG: hypothetical protein HOY78_02245 [Saccharothrix sp.]|nr:hypothetical protein [Saccharothrix sp.]